jgi:hypothetical protein
VIGALPTWPYSAGWGYYRDDVRWATILQITAAVYGVGARAVDPAGTGEGPSVEPSVFGGFLYAALLDAGVGNGLRIAAVMVVLVPLVSDCSHDARNAMPMTIAIRENTYLFIRLLSTSRRTESLVVSNQMKCWKCVCLVCMDNEII